MMHSAWLLFRAHGKQFLQRWLVTGEAARNAVSQSGAGAATPQVVKLITSSNLNTLGIHGIK